MNKIMKVTFMDYTQHFYNVHKPRTLVGVHKIRNSYGNFYLMKNMFPVVLCFHTKKILPKVSFFRHNLCKIVNHFEPD